MPLWHVYCQLYSDHARLTKKSMKQTERRRATRTGIFMLIHCNGKHIYICSPESAGGSNSSVAVSHNFCSAINT